MMFDYWFPPHWSTMKKMIYLHAILKNKQNEQQEEQNDEEGKNDDEEL